MIYVKKIWKFLSSMKFAIILLLVLSAACTGGSFITQGQTYEWYVSRYSERTAAAIMTFGLDDVFHSWWFILITLFLCLNLLLCNVLRFPSLWKRWKKQQAPILNSGGLVDEQKQDSLRNSGGLVDEQKQNSLRNSNRLMEEQELGKKAAGTVPADRLEKVFAEMGFRKPMLSNTEQRSIVQEGVGQDNGLQGNAARNSIFRADVVRESNIRKTGTTYYYASKNRIGIWGAWVCHLGILIVIAGFGLGQSLKQEYTVYGVPGQSKVVGSTDYIVTIDDFRIDLREDDTVEQYTADLTVRDAGNGTSQSGSVSVNNPRTMYGMKFYQNSTGWAATVTVLKDGEQIQQEVICAGEYLSVEDKEGLVIMFSAFYPDYYRDEQYGPMTASSQPDNPGYLYRAYYMNQVIGMNVLTGEDVITIDEYTVIFSDPQPYTLIQIKRDPFTPIALIGGLVILIGLVLAFYLQPAQLWAVAQEDGTWTVWGKCQKGGPLFEEQLRESILRAGGQLLIEAEGRENTA